MQKRSADSAYLTDKVNVLLHKYPESVNSWHVAIRTQDDPKLDWNKCEWMELCILLQYESGPGIGMYDEFMESPKEVEHTVEAEGMWLSRYDATQVPNVTQESIKALRAAEDQDTTDFYTMFMKCNRALGNVFFAADYFACDKTLDFIRMVFVRRFTGSNATYKRPLLQILMNNQSTNQEMIEQVTDFFRLKLGSRLRPLTRLQTFHIREHHFIPDSFCLKLQEALPQARVELMADEPNVFIELGIVFV